MAHETHEHAGVSTMGILTMSECDNHVDGSFGPHVHKEAAGSVHAMLPAGYRATRSKDDACAVCRTQARAGATERAQPPHGCNKVDVCILPY